MGQIHLVRHGQAAFGTEDYDRLTELGFEQARLLGAWHAVSGRRIDQAVTGRMTRHRQTAEACLAALPSRLRPAGEWVTDAGFDEYDADEVVLRSHPELAQPRAMKEHLARCADPRRAFHAIFSAAMGRWMGGGHDGDYAESWKAFQARVVAALKRAVEASGPSRATFIFTSGGPIAAICQHLLGLDPKRTLDVNTVLVNCATTGVLYQPEMVSLSHLNNYAHLEQARDPKMVTYR
jgi:broad specificity phosphatase PhoE